MEFNQAQLRAIHTIKGPLMVISCAGSGKTSVILERAQQIVRTGAASSRILVVTFSRAAARELEERYRERYGRCGIRFSTIHSLCYSVLSECLRLGPEAILREEEKRRYFRQAHEEGQRRGEKEAAVPFEEFYPEICAYISRRMNRGGADEAAGRGFREELFRGYGEYKRRTRRVDFDDMTVLCHRYLKNRPEVLLRWQGVFDYIMIDEYQDTGTLQAEIFFMLAMRHENLCVVGDDDQSIYGFRGADSGVFDAFRRTFPQHKCVVMDTNYRSLPVICAAAARLIDYNSQRIPKEFHAARQGKGKLEVASSGTAEEQLEKALEWIRANAEQGVEYRDMAVLYRLKREAAALVDRLILEKIPFFIRELPEDMHKGMVFGDVMAYYRLSRGFGETEDLVRIINRPKRYIKTGLVRGCAVDRNALYTACTRDCHTRQEYERVGDVVNRLFLDLRSLKALGPAEFMEYLDAEMGYRDSLREYAEYCGLDTDALERDFMALAKEAEYFNGMADWQAYGQDEGKLSLTDENGVYLSTFHGAKGLEWEKVFLISAEEGVTPYRYRGRIEDPEEERRLFYVALTRAREELVISYVEDASSFRRASGFLEEMGMQK